MIFLMRASGANGLPLTMPMAGRSKAPLELHAVEGLHANHREALPGPSI
jgi:hypothetical protein